MLPALDQVLRPLATTLAATFLANPRNDQTVPGHSKSVLASHSFAKFLEFFAAKFDQLVALLTEEVVVLWVAVVVFVDGSPTKCHLPKEASVDQLAKRSINGRPADTLWG